MINQGKQIQLLSSRRVVTYFSIMLYFQQYYNLYGLKQKHPPEVFYKKDVLKKFAKFIGIHLCQNLFFNKVAGLRPATKKEILAQVFSCEFSKIYKNTFFREHLWMTASININPYQLIDQCLLNNLQLRVLLYFFLKHALTTII